MADYLTVLRRDIEQFSKGNWAVDNDKLLMYLEELNANAGGGGGGGGGGGNTVNYYLNGGTNQGTFSGNTYYEMSTVPVTGAAANFTINADGYIAQFITDANDPSKTSIPSGNWNFEMYFSASSSGGSPSFYVELSKWDGVSFTPIATSSGSPEGITNGTTLDLYTTALTVPSTTLLATDRLAIRIYVIHSGRTITLHTQDNTLCEITTTFLAPAQVDIKSNGTTIATTLSSIDFTGATKVASTGVGAINVSSNYANPYFNSLVTDNVIMINGINSPVGASLQGGLNRYTLMLSPCYFDFKVSIKRIGFQIVSNQGAGSATLFNFCLYRLQGDNYVLDISSQISTPQYAGTKVPGSDRSISITGLFTSAEFTYTTPLSIDPGVYVIALTSDSVTGATVSYQLGLPCTLPAPAKKYTTNTTLYQQFTNRLSHLVSGSTPYTLINDLASLSTFNTAPTISGYTIYGGYTIA